MQTAELQCTGFVCSHTPICPLLLAEMPSVGNSITAELDYREIVLIMGKGAVAGGVRSNKLVRPISNVRTR